MEPLESRRRSPSPPRRSRRDSPKRDKKRRSRSKSKSKSPSPAGPAKTAKVQVTGLTRNVTKEHLAEIFGVYGNLKEVDMPTDRVHTHLGKGEAFVAYATVDDAEKAMKHMDGGQIDGSELSILPYHPPQVRVRKRTRTPPRRTDDRYRRSPPRGPRGYSPPRRRRSRSRSPPRRRRSRS